MMEMDERCILSIEGLSVRFPTRDGYVQAITSLHLQLEPGERFGLIGETGSGKTVLGMAIMRLLPDYAEVSGRVIYNGKDLLALDEEAMRRIRGGEIALIMQNSGTTLNPLNSIGDHLTETIRYHARNSRSGDLAEETMRAIVSKVQMQNHDRMVRSYPHQLSGGMKQRVMVGLGIASEPTFVIADEPTTGLDPKIKRDLVSLLKKEFGGKGLLFITHDLEVAAEIAERIGVLYAGELVEVGPLDEVVGDPLHPYTQGLLQSLPGQGCIPIPGFGPSLIRLPEGCRFHPRCHAAMKQCRSMHPELQDHGGDHYVRCHLFD